MTLHYLIRAETLYNIGSYQETETLLRQALAEDPNSSYARALLAMTLVQRNRLQEAEKEARTAVRLAPDDAFGHFALGRVMLRQDNQRAALAAAHEAIRLDPEDPSFYALLGKVYLSLDQYQPVLEAAEAGLKLDPQHGICTTLQHIALVRLGRNGEAQQVINEALRRSPLDPFAHAGQGWLALERGDLEQALTSFREALRLQPHNDMARRGLVETLKARNIIYRQLLRFFFWTSRLKAGQRWAIIIGGVVLVQILRGAAASTPGLEPLVVPITLIYAAFIFLTWTADALFNLFLRLNKYGRFALDAEQRLASDLVGLCLAVGAVLAVVGLLASGGLQNELLEAGAKSAVMVIPVAGIFQADRPNQRRALIWFALGLATLIVLKLLIGLAGTSAGVLTGLFVIGFVAYTWVGAFMVN